MAGLKARLLNALYRLTLSRHSERWEGLKEAIRGPMKFRLMLYLSANNPASKDDVIAFVMGTGQVRRRESAVRTVNRLLEELRRKGLAEVSGDGLIRLKRRTAVIVGEPPGVWITSGLGMAVVLMGLAVALKDAVLLASSARLSGLLAGRHSLLPPKVLPLLSPPVSGLAYGAVVRWKGPP